MKINLIANRFASVCLHADGFSQNRGQCRNMIMTLFSLFVGSHGFIYSMCMCVLANEVAEQQSNFNDTSFSPSQMAKVSKMVTLTLSHRPISTEVDEEFCHS